MKSGSASREMAEKLAIGALGYIALEPEQLGRFLALTGIGPEAIRSAAREPGFLAGVLDFVASDERLLIAFAAHAGIDPMDIGRAQAALSGQFRERDRP